MFSASPARKSYTPMMARLSSRTTQEVERTPLLLAQSIDFDNESKKDGFGGAIHGVLYGVVGLVCMVPTLVSYAHIIFNSPTEFASFMPMLVKMLYLSSALHQLVFTLRSCMPFACGQIQDVGLIFLSAIVRDILRKGQDEGMAPEEIVATSLWVCALATAFVGVLVFAVGKAKLTECVQLIPLPVVGGYLGYIGYFSLAAGLSITTGEYISGPNTFALLLNADFTWKLVTMFSLTVVFFICLKHGGMFGMPIVMAAAPIIFFATVFATGHTVADAQAAGWLPKESVMATGLEAVKLYDPSLVRWSLFPRQIPNVCCLAIVVIFGSSLDIAAVQAEYPEKLDFNAEMQTVGYANMLSGAFGGFTGSYIFAQTIFALKVKVGSRWQGIIIIIGELALFLAAWDFQQVLPLAYIGAIMGFFGIEIMHDWLIASRALVSQVEYCLLWFSFIFIVLLSGDNSFGVLEGMIAASVMAAIVFAFHYARVRTWRMVPTMPSSVVRNFEQTRTLHRKRDEKIFCVRIRGYIFFGSTLDILRLQRRITESTARFVIIDFSRCDGLDSSAASTFSGLKTALTAKNMDLFITAAKGEVGSLLRSHGVFQNSLHSWLREGDVLDMDDALKICEDRIVGRICNSRCDLHEHLLSFVGGYPSHHELESLKLKAKRLSLYFAMRTIPKGQTLFRRSDPADAMYLLSRGSIAASRHAKGEDKSRGIPNFGYARPGTLLGDLALYSGMDCHLYDTHAAEDSVVGMITRETIEKLEHEAPDLLLFFQRILLRNMSNFSVQSLESMW